MIHKDGIENNFVDWQDFSIDQTYQQHLKYIQKKEEQMVFFLAKNLYLLWRKKRNQHPNRYEWKKKIVVELRII